MGYSGQIYEFTETVIIRELCNDLLHRELARGTLKKDNPLLHMLCNRNEIHFFIYSSNIRFSVKFYVTENLALSL